MDRVERQLSPLREAIATAAGSRPSLLDDPSFRSAAAALDGRNAALVAYTRGDLATELDQMWIGPSVKPQGTFTALTDGLGLADTALAIGANQHGVWLRASPHVLSNGYHPGPTFTPTLVRRLPRNSIAYLGIENGGAQLPEFDRLLAPVLGDEGSTPGPASAAIADEFHVTPADLGAIGAGEQAWFLGQTSGAVFRPGNLSRAEAVLKAEAARNATAGITSGHDGDTVWIHARLVSGSPVVGPSPAELIARAGLPHRVSWVLAVNLGFLTGLAAEDQSGAPPNPENSVSGAVLATAPASNGRYRLDLYFDIEG